jgi:hypothetical protein
MKKLLLIVIVGLASLAQAQNPILDTAVLGPGYTNDVFYSMANGTVATVPGNNWHIALSVRGAMPPFNVMRSTTILANEGRGVSIFKSNQTNWSTFDTTNYRTWPNPHNSDSTWDEGALNTNRSNDPFDFGWGVYDQSTHNLTGTAIFLVRITTGSGPNATTSFKKLFINKLAYDTQWVYTFANLNNTDSNQVMFNKSAFQGKLFAYQNLNSNAPINREPAQTWDVLFTRYGAFVTAFGQTIFSATTGALTHPSVVTSRVQGVPNNLAAAGSWSSKLTNIGTDWKNNPGPGQPNFTMKDSLVFFVRAANGREDRLIFTSLTTSATGIITFEKKQTQFATALNNQLAPLQVTAYPNPADNELHISLPEPANVTIADVTGKIFLQQHTETNATTLNIGELPSGLYFVKVTTEQKSGVVRLVVQ